MTQAQDIAEALRALGRDAVAIGGHVVTLGTVLAAAQRKRLDALHVSVALDTVAPRSGCTWRPACVWCVEALEVALGRDIEAHRVNKDTGHDSGCCAACDVTGLDVMVASVPDDAFARPPRRFLEIRCAYRDRGGRLLAQLEAAP